MDCFMYTYTMQECSLQSLHHTQPSTASDNQTANTRHGFVEARKMVCVDDSKGRSVVCY